MNVPFANRAGAESLLGPINEPTAEERLKHLSDCIARFSAGEEPLPQTSSFVNNHIHTIYSFSPYSPSDAVYRSWLNGLATTGIMDHDSVSGAFEFIEAGKLLGIATTVGFECRCRLTGTPFLNRRLNNPDQSGISYVACHGIPHQFIQETDDWLKPYRLKRILRNQRMTERLNVFLGDPAFKLDFERDILPLSQAKLGGSVTERHILYALACKVIAATGQGEPLLQLLSERYGLHAAGKVREALLDKGDPFYAYRVLGLLKSSLVEKFYIDAEEECPHIRDFVAFVQSIGAIPAYPYLGDVGESVTGDKKTQSFEDDFLDELIPWLKGIGFTSVTYMPTRNSLQQLKRLMRLCDQHELFQVSGEDINTPFQSFVCEHLARAEFSHLVTSAWALIGHEKAATENLDQAMFSGKTVSAYPALGERISYFTAIGQGVKGGV